MSMVELPPCPPGPLLLIISFINSVCCTLNFSNWREYLPLGLGDASKNGWLSHELPQPFQEHFPHLMHYSDFLKENDYEMNISSVYEYAFQTPTTALGDLASTDSMVAIFILVLILRQFKKLTMPIFSNIGRNVARQTHGPDWEKEKENKEKIFKFGEYVFRLIYHTTVSVVGVWYFWDKSWWAPSKGGMKNIFTNYPHQTIETGMMWYYLVQCAYNVDAIVHLIELSFVVKIQNPFSSSKGDDSKKKQIGFASLSPVRIEWSPNCRGDFREMAFHHALTNALVFLSSYYRFEIGGSTLFIVHDISDIPVDLSKLANFMKWKITTIACFVTMMIVWAITRLGVLPFYIVKGIFMESYLLVTENDMDIRHYRMLQPIFYPMYIALIALHVFWFSMFIKIGYYLVFKKELHDLTEHKSGEKQEKKKNS